MHNFMLYMYTSWHSNVFSWCTFQDNFEPSAVSTQDPYELVHWNTNFFLPFVLKYKIKCLKKTLLEDLWTLWGSSLLLATLTPLRWGGFKGFSKLKSSEWETTFPTSHSLFHMFTSTQIIIIMLLVEQRPHFSSAIFHSIYYSIMEQDVSTYTVPPAHKRNTEGRFLCGFEKVPAMRCSFASSHILLYYSSSPLYFYH